MLDGGLNFCSSDVDRVVSKVDIDYKVRRLREEGIRLKKLRAAVLVGQIILYEGGDVITTY